MPRHPALLRHLRQRGAAAVRRDPVSRTTPSGLRMSPRSVLGNDEFQPFVSHGEHLLSDGSGGPRASCRWTTPGRMVVGRANGYRPHYSWVEATRVSVNTLTPWSSRRVLTPRPSRWQRDALPLSYYCDGGTGWSLTSVARVAIGYLNPRSRCQGCGGGHRTPDDGG